MRTRIVIRCPPKRRPVTEVEADESVSSVSSYSRTLLPDINRKRVYDYIPPIKIPIFLRPFWFLATLFRHEAGSNLQEGHQERYQTYVVPICIWPDIVFYIINFLHAPIIGFLLYTGWYTITFRETLLSILSDEAFAGVNRPEHCHPTVHSSSAVFGMHIDGLRCILLAALILILCVIGVIGFYTDSKSMLAIWLLLGGTIYLENYLGFEAKSALRLNVCYKGITELTLCFYASVNAYWTNMHTYYQYGPARAVDFIQYSFECCGVKYADEYLSGPYIPASCITTLWNKNIYYNYGAVPITNADFVYQEGCVFKMIARCRAVRGLLIYAMRPVYIYHMFLYITGVVAVALYFGMLRTSAIYSFAFNDNLRKYIFPKNSGILPMMAGEQMKDGRIEPGDLLRLHLQSEFIKNFGSQSEHLDLDLPPEAERYVDKLRRQLGIGNEELGIYNGLEAPPDVIEAMKSTDDACGVEFLYRNIKAKSRIKDKVETLISAERSKYRLDPATIQLHGRPVPGKAPDFKLTPEKAQEQLREGGGAQKTTSLWKWRQKDPLDVPRILKKVKEEVAEEAVRKRTILLGQPLPPSALKKEKKSEGSAPAKPATTKPTTKPTTTKSAVFSQPPDPPPPPPEPEPPK